MQKPKIDLSVTTPVACDKCQGQTFIEATMFRKVSALLTDNGQEGLVPIPIVSCLNCGEPLQMLLPKELRTNIVAASKIVS